MDGAAALRLDSVTMPIYEYRCDACSEAYEEYLSTSDKPTPPCPKCGSAKVTRILSTINTEWLPSDVAWDRVGRSWD
jgi:putative FmdB family regulatory protein